MAINFWLLMISRIFHTHKNERHLFNEQWWTVVKMGIFNSHFLHIINK